MIIHKLLSPILLMSLIGFGMAFHPFMQVKEVGPNAYMTIVLGFLATGTILILIQRLNKKFPDQNIFGWGHTLLGPLGWFGSLLFILFIFLFDTMLVKRVTEFTSAAVLFRTPGWASIAAYVLILTYISIQGEESTGRLASILIGLVVLSTLILVLGFSHFKLPYVHPAYLFRDLNYLKYGWTGFICFIPFLMISASLHSNLRQQNLIASATVPCIGALFLILATFEMAGVFGPLGITRYSRPLYSLMGTIHLYSEYFFQNIILSIHIFNFMCFTMVTASILLRIVCKGLLELFHIQQNKLGLFTIFTALGIFILATLPGLITTLKYVPLVLFFGSLYTLFYITLLWVTSLFHRRTQ